MAGLIALVALIALYFVPGIASRIPLSVILNLAHSLLAFTRNTQEKKPARPSMDKQEARLILDLPEQATEEDIRKAHRRLIQKNHPDAGGSAYLAARINQARDVLLK